MTKRPAGGPQSARPQRPARAEQPQAAERLQKYMARCGVASRRKCEELIANGLVEVNGTVVREPGVKIDPGRDHVRVDGKALRTEKPAYYIHYKVKGVTTTVADDLGRRTVMDCLPGIKERVYPVGRLDKESEGLLVLTNDGEMANYLTHPAHGVEKTYRVVAEGRIEPDTLRALAEKGMRLGPVLVKPSRVELVRHETDSTVLLISVGEGINREVRRIFAALGHEVKKLLRVQVGPLSLQKMKRGETRLLTAAEIERLRRGMAGAAPEAEKEEYGPGSAAARRPTGPRGRPRPNRPGKQQRPSGKRERTGKPDPAAAVARPARAHGPERKAIAAKPGKPLRPERGKGTAATKPGKTPQAERGNALPAARKTLQRASGAAAKQVTGKPVAAKPGRPLRPERKSAAKQAATKPERKPERKPAAPPARHPLARQPAGRPIGNRNGSPKGRPKGKPGRTPDGK